MVSPRRVRDPDLLGSGVELAQEARGDPQGARARDGLRGGDLE